jgi:hypothetical protein
MLSLLTASLARIPATQRDHLATFLARLPWLESRRRGHRDSLRTLLMAGERFSRDSRTPHGPMTHREAVRRHIVWTLEFLAEMGGHRHPIEDRTSGMWGPRHRARLVVTAHCGNWIVGSRALARALGPIHSTAGLQLRRGWQPAIRACLSRQGIVLTDFDGLRRALRNRETVVLHLDGQAGGYRRRAVPIGVRSAALLAAESGASVYAALCVRSGAGRFVLEGSPLSLGSRRVGSRQSRSKRASDWEATFLRILHEWVRRDPADWLLFSSDHLGAFDHFGASHRLGASNHAGRSDHLAASNHPSGLSNGNAHAGNLRSLSIHPENSSLQEVREA